MISTAVSEFSWPCTGWNSPSNIVTYPHFVFSPRPLTASTVTRIPPPPYGSYVITLLKGGGASDCIRHAPMRGFLLCAERSLPPSSTRAAAAREVKRFRLRIGETPVGDVGEVRRTTSLTPGASRGPAAPR